MTDIKADETRTIVRDHYASVATKGGGCAPGCCDALTASTPLGYSSEDAAAAPDGADLGLGCGNPTAIASLRTGETVLDLGSGGGFDCFIAAKQVGPTGKVIGVDMTPEMISRARANAAKIEAKNVEFRLGEIEHLPVPDQSVDAIVSNCVVNLSPEKSNVFHEAFRVLKPGGRIALSDIVAIAPIPEAIQREALALAGCIAGAAPIEDVRRMLNEAGFTNVRVEPLPHSAAIVSAWLPGIEKFVASATIEATRPGASASCCGPECCA
jgi:SAM-dependent methyltransferase